MAEQPLIESQVLPQVQPSAQLPMNANPDAFGGAVGRAISNVGAVATEIHERALNEARQTNVLAADNATNAFLQNRVHGPDGVLNQPAGKDAPEAVDKTIADYDAHVAKQLDQLTDDRQKIAFKRMADQRRFQMEHQLGQYEVAQTERHADDVDTTALANAATSAVQNADNPEIVSNAIDLQKAVIADMGKRKGMARQKIEELQKEAASETHLGVLKQLLSTGQDITAKAWYDDHKGEFVAKDSDNAASMVQAGSTAGESARIADSIVLGKNGKLLDPATVDERIRSNPELVKNTRLRDEVQTRVDQRFQQEDRASRAREKDAFGQAYAAMNAAPDGIYNPRVVTLMATMSPEAQEQLRGYAKKEGKVVTDPSLMRQVELGLADPKTRAKWMEYDPTIRPNEFSQEDMKHVTGLQAKYLSSREEADNLSNGTLTRDQAISTALKNAGLDPESERNKPSNDPETPNAYFAIDREVRAVQQVTGKKLTPDEITKIGTALLVKRVYTANPWYQWDDKGRPFQLTPAQVPKAERDKIVAQFNERRQSPSEQAILDQYLLKISTDALNAGQ